MNSFKFIIPSKNIIIFYKSNKSIIKPLKFYINKKLKKNIFSYHFSNQNLNIFKKVLSNIYTYIDFLKYKKKIDKKYLLNFLKYSNNNYDLIIVKENYKSIYFDYKKQLVRKIFHENFIDTNSKLISELSNYMNISLIKIEKNLILEKLIDGEFLSHSEINIQFLEKIYFSSLNRKNYTFEHEKDLLKISNTISRLPLKKYQMLIIHI